MDRSQDKQPQPPFFRAYPYVLGLMLGLVLLLVMILKGWNSLHPKDQILDASVLAMSVPDYSGSRPAGSVQIIGLSIIGDAIRDSDPLAGDIPSRLASVTAVLLLPVPTATPIYALDTIPSSTWTLTVEIRLSPTLTVTKTNLPTSTQTLIASITPTPSQTVPALTETIPTTTDTIQPTIHPTETQTPTPPSTSVPPTPQRTHTHPVHPTEKPTHTPDYH
jgi:hypothetical protein